MQEIGGKTELPDGDRTVHHIRIQCSKSIFVSTKDYPLGSSNEHFEVPKKNSREKGFSIKIMDTPNLQTFHMQTGQDTLLIEDQTHDIMFFLEKTLCHEKVRSRVWSFSPAQSRGNDKYHIRANLNQRFIDKD